MSINIVIGDSNESNIELTKPVLELKKACDENTAFEVLEVRSFLLPNDTLIVDCCNSEIPSRNSYGIKNRERLALIFSEEFTIPYEVQALREDFPPTLHQNDNYLVKGHSLCLYESSWDTEARTWTPQRHLNRILWWLKETSLGILHKEDQPLEQLFYTTNQELILPIKFNEKILKLNTKFFIYPVRSLKNKLVVRGTFEEDNKKQSMDTVIVLTEPLTHDSPSKYPRTLGDLELFLKNRGANLFYNLESAIRSKVDSNGILENGNGIFLILILPIRRNKESKPEKNLFKGFFIKDYNIATFGKLCDIFSNDAGDGKYYEIVKVNKSTFSIEALKGIQIDPIEITFPLSKSYARMNSKIDEEEAKFNGILAGVGTLGSAVAEIWSKEAWGEWVFVDNDYIKPHNIIRHSAKDIHIGNSKAEVVKYLCNINFEKSYVINEAIIDNITNFDNRKLWEKINDAQVLIDATTTLEVPRDLSVVDNIPRSVSIFVTPSGKDCVLLLEDKKRNVRLDTIECQYYRALISNEWGAGHLEGNQGELRVGAGCRDKSFLMNQELILLHASTLARHTRLALRNENANIRVWKVDKDSGEIKSINIPVVKSLKMKLDEWTVVYDKKIIEKLFYYRNQKLPNETGGIVLGYTDQVVKRIFVVDILSAPDDSVEKKNEYIRGVSGLLEKIEFVLSRTAKIVTYIGEWHSHPPKCTAKPSSIDLVQSDYLAKELLYEGIPGIMIIVGDNMVNINLTEINNFE